MQSWKLPQLKRVLLQPRSHIFSLSKMYTWSTTCWLLAKGSCDHSRKIRHPREILQILIVHGKANSTKYSGFKYEQETTEPLGFIVSGPLANVSIWACTTSVFPLKHIDWKQVIIPSQVWFNKSKSRTWPRLHHLLKNRLPANHASCVLISLLYCCLFCGVRGFFACFLRG